MSLITVLPFNFCLFYFRGMWRSPCFSSHNFLLCPSFSTSKSFSRFVYIFLLSYLSLFLNISLIFPSCFPVENCLGLASFILWHFLMVSFIFLFVFLFRPLPEFSCRFFLAVLSITLLANLSNKYFSYFFHLFSSIVTEVMKLLKNET